MAITIYDECTSSRRAYIFERIFYDVLDWVVYTLCTTSMSVFKATPHYQMEIHVLLLSTMTPEDTRINLDMYGIAFDSQPATIQKFKWVRDERPITVSLWVACQHPIVDHLAPSFMPHMDACVCWYHDHDGLSCVNVKNGIGLLQTLHQNIWMMATTYPEKQPQHKSQVKHYYNEHGFELRRLTNTLDANIEEILRVHLDIQKNL